MSAATIPARPALFGVWFSSTLSTLLPAHQHACPELNLIMSGHLSYRVEGRDAPLLGHAGQLIVLPRGLNHDLIHASEDVALWVLELNGSVAVPWLDQAQVLHPDPAWRKAVVGSARSLWLRPQRAEALELQSKLEEALRALSCSGPPARSEPVHPAVVRAKQVCESQADVDLDIARLARSSGLSASWLAHLFSDQVGITPLQYRNFVRVQRFIRTYNGDERNLLGAALQFGFGSYAQFHRVFRQVCGKSPAEHFRWLSDSGEVDAQTTLRTTVLPKVTLPLESPYL